ncbi:MAG: hypothetical protein Q9212_007331, partial [Teloschistes hypoglaucus]
PPSFDNDTLASVVDLPEEVRAARSALINGADELRKLAMGPAVFGTEMALGVCSSLAIRLDRFSPYSAVVRMNQWELNLTKPNQWTDSLALRFIYHYKLASHVPLDGSITYASLSAAVSLPELLIFRFVRAAMASNIFDETPSGEIRHTAISRLLATSPGFADIVGLELEELAPAGSSYIAALEKWGPETLVKEPSKTAFALSNGVEMPVFAYLAQRPERARRFGGAMQFWTKDESWDLRHIAAAFDWSSLDRPGARIVDVGGGHGGVSTYIARKTERVNFLVQDLPHVIEVAQKAQVAANEKGEDGDLKGMIVFETHDFLTPQTLEEKPDAFLLRWILHDWPEDYCIRILRNLVPALKPGVKILIYEYVLADKPVKKTTEKIGL